MEEIKDPSKIIAQNTIVLYTRTIVVIIVSLYTSRVVLYSLGITNWGIYSIVGGFVSMFSFLNTSMSVSTQRFITFELGKKDTKKLNSVFCQSINIHFLVSIITFIILETVGSYYIFNKLNVPHNRINEAYICFQFSTLALIVDIMSVPFNAEILAHEKMKVFAYVEMVNAILKLLISLAIQFMNDNKLVLYSGLILVLVVLIRIFYGEYCARKIPECKYKFFVDKPILKKMLSFAGWISLSSISVVLRDQGINVLYNMFIGVIVNAAFSVAQQVHYTIYNLSNNIQVAFSPQLTKSIASENTKHSKNIVYSGSKISVILLLIFMIPVYFRINYVLNLWLKEVPANTGTIIILLLINTFIISYASTCITTIRANGKIRKYEIIINCINFTEFVVTYFMLKNFPDVKTPLYLLIASSIIQIFVMISMASKILHFNIFNYVYEIIIKSFFVILPSYLICKFVSMVSKEIFFSLIYIVIISTISVLTFSYFLYLNRREREVIYKIRRKLLSKHESI
jgi:O-antigen/teichoic acid export membrane protein